MGTATPGVIVRKLFVSYPRENRRDVDQLVAHLGLMGYDTWVDSDLRGGQDWWEEVLRRIADSDVFIAIISRAVLNSTACRRELAWAEALGRPVLPVAVEPPPAALPRGIARRQIVDYSQANQRDRAALILHGSLVTVPAAPPLPDPLPGPPAAPLSYLTDLVDLVARTDSLDRAQQHQTLQQLGAALRSADPEERRGGQYILERFATRADLYADVDRGISALRQVPDQPSRVDPLRRAEKPTPPPIKKAADASVEPRQESERQLQGPAKQVASDAPAKSAKQVPDQLRLLSDQTVPERHHPHAGAKSAQDQASTARGDAQVAAAGLRDTNAEATIAIAFAGASAADRSGATKPLPPFETTPTNECGAPIAQVSRPAEYKQVTVLFADVVHSMDIAAAVGAERLREIMTELVERSAAVMKRYGGTLSQFTGDGIMAVFGAPITLEDHAVRACLAALAVQEEAKRLAAEVHDRDGIDMRLRVGLNSGQVIAGEIGSGSFGYTAVGEQVGMAQRMVSVAPSGGVMISASTARLVEGAATLGEPELVQIKGADAPVRARRLLGIGERHRAAGRAQSTLVGRRWEMSAIESLLDRAVDGHGAVVGVVGSPGIGKSRLVREVSALAAARNVGVFTAFCESHTSQVAFRAVARLLRAAIGVEGLDGQTARDRVRKAVAGADPEDLVLFDDLLGIGDPEVKLPKIDPDARRRRLTALVNAASLARQTPAVYVIEDAHWIDGVSESLLADFFMVIPQTPSLVLVTYRPEYRGALSRVGSAQTIALAPLSDSETAALVAELLGPDASVGALGPKIAERAAGNPFFAEEMVRELAERGVLCGEPGAYLSAAEGGEVSVPATLQATIAARIDRLDPKAKRTLSAAAVIGSRFSLNLLETLGIDPVLEHLVASELIDQIRFTGQPEYVFHHPLIRTVAYASQLKSDRAELHRRVATAIESRDPTSAEENAALIAEHLEAAGDLHAAYGWHMRAATWATNRDIAAARLSWERAQKIADALPAEDPNRATMRIAPRTMLCGIAWRVHEHVAGARFEELRELCAAVGDKASLAIAMAGLVMDLAFQARLREASQLASEAWALIESVGDATLTVGLSMPLIYTKAECAEFCDVLRWSQRVIDLADGDPSKGNFLIGSPLALAFTTRGNAGYWLGRPEWRDDLRHGLAMAHSADPMSYATVVGWAYFPGIALGVLGPDDRAIREIEDALRIADRSGDDLAAVFVRATLGVALVHRQTDAERDRGQKLLAEVGDVFRRRGNNLSDLPLVEVRVARERARRGDCDDAIPLMRAAVDHLFREGHLLAWSGPATCVLVETLLDRGADGDVAEAQAAIERLAAAPADDRLAVREICLLRLRALLARAQSDETAYRDYRDRYRDMATSLGFEGHMKWAEAMP